MKRLLLITITALFSFLGFAKIGPDFSPNQEVTLCGPNDVFFVCTAPENPDNIWWDFGDGTLGTGLNPTHRYTTTGVYTVKMITQKSGVKDSIIKTNFVTVNPKPASSFVVDLSGVPVPFQRKFKFTGFSNADSISIYKWMVNGVTVNGSSYLNYTFPANGDYAIGLKVTNNKGCSDEFEDSITINDTPLPAGLETLSSSEKLTVMVNIAQPTISIARSGFVNEEADVHIIDIMGRVVLHAKMNKGESTMELATGELRPGAYIVELSSQSFVAAKRFDKIML